MSFYNFMSSAANASLNRGPDPVGGWVELGRTTLGSSGSTITVSSLSDKRYYMVLCDIVAGTGTTENEFRLNGDTGTNYSWRWSNNGTEGSATSQDYMVNGTVGFSGNHLGVSYFANRSASEKLQLGHGVNNASAGEATAPNRNEYVGKWENTSNAISQMQQVNLAGGGSNYASGSELVVLGWDPDDTHTNNFWEELADASWSSGSSFDTGTFTAKKYLWVQGWVDSATTNYYPLIDVGNGTLDTGTNYALRRSYDGNADVTSTSRASWEIEMSGTASPKYFNLFIVNNASNEKLGIMHAIAQLTAGATTAPSRRETVCKWDNTSNQINIIGLKTTTGDFTGGQIKVWGAD